MKKIEKIKLPIVNDPRGNLTFIESQKHIPFNIERVFWIYDVPGGESRGGHAYKNNDEFLIALSGSFDVVVDDNKSIKTFQLNRSYFGIFIPSGTWRHLENFSTNSLALILSSTKFNKSDYITNYNEYKSFNSNRNINIKRNTKFENIDKINPKISKLEACLKFNLDINHRDKGNITVVENRENFPFNIKRVYYLYDVPGGEERGGHAHKELHQFIIAANGSFDVKLNDGESEKIISLNRSFNCLKIIPGIWRELYNFSSGSICLVLASEFYNENDYIRNFNDFLNFKND